MSAISASDQYKKKLGAKTTDDTAGQNDEEKQVNEYYALAEDQQYTKLLDKEIQLENSKSNALKYTNNAMAANGLNATGYGSSANAGIYNQYLSNLSTMKQDTDTEVNNLESEKRSELNDLSDDRFESLTTMLSQAQSSDDLNSLMSDYGYGTINEDTGEFSWNEKPSNMSDDDWAQLKYYYKLQNETIASNTDTTPDYATYTSLDTLKAATFVQSDGNVATFQDHFDSEANLVWHHASVGDYSAGDTIKITNGEGVTVYLQWTGSDYGFRQCTQSDYDKSANQYTITRNKNKGNDYAKVK